MDKVNEYIESLKKEREQRLERLKQEISDEETNKEKIILKEALGILGAILFVIFSFFYWVGGFYLLDKLN